MTEDLKRRANYWIHFEDYWIHFEDNPEFWHFCRGVGTWNGSTHKVWFMGPLQIWWHQ